MLLKLFSAVTFFLYLLASPTPLTISHPMLDRIVEYRPGEEFLFCIDYIREDELYKNSKGHLP